MVQVAYRKIVKEFEVDFDGSIIQFKKGKYILSLPQCDTPTHYMVAYEHSPFRIEKEYLEDKYKNDVPWGEVI